MKIYLGNKKKSKRKDITYRDIENIIKDTKYLISDRPKLSGSFMVDKNDMLQFYKSLRDTYLSQIKDIEDSIQKANITYMYLKNKGVIESNPFLEEIEECNKRVKKLKELVEPITEQIERLEKE